MTSEYFGGKSGGSIGGLGNLDNYDGSALSHEKTKLIQNLASDVKKIMKVKVDLDMDDTKGLVKFLNEYVVLHIKTINSGAHKEICMALAEALNHRYGHTIVDPKASPHQVCEAVSKSFRSLGASLQNEFVSIHTDIKRILSNIEIVRNALESSFTKLYNTAQSSEDSQARTNAEFIKAQYDAATIILNQLVAQMADLLNTTIDPTTKTLLELDTINSPFKTLIADARIAVGTQNMANKLTAVISDMSQVGVLAHQVDKALKQIGMSVPEYKKLQSNDDITEKAYEHFSHGSHDAAELAKFISALQIIKNANFSHDDIASVLESKKGGLNGPKSLEKRMESQGKIRNLLFKDFDHRLRRQTLIIKAALAKMMPKIGTSIKLDDKLDAFVKAFDALSNDIEMDREDFYMALTGYRTDQISKDEKSRYLGKIRHVISTLGHFHDLEFNTVRKALEEQVTMIDNFNDKFLKPATNILRPLNTDILPSVNGGKKRYKYGRGTKDDSDDEASASDHDDHEEESHEDHDDNSHEEKYNAPLKKSITFEHDHSTGHHGVKDYENYGEQAEVTAAGVELGSFTSMKTLARDLHFFYRAAQTRMLLKSASKEIESYSQDYKSVLGDAIGDLIIKEKRAYADLENKFADETTGFGLKLTESVKAANTPFMRSIKTHLFTLRKEQLDVKVDFLKTVEALDLYMMSFANAIASNPDDVKDLSSLLENVEIIAKWFSETSGNNLAQLFEMLPYEDAKFNNTDAYTTHNEEHYYEWVSRHLAIAGKKLGDVSLPVIDGIYDDKSSESFGMKLLAQSRKVFNTVRVLDNIVAAFTEIGSKFNNKNLSDNTFMAPGMILKNLRRYLYHSVITHHVVDLDGKKGKDGTDAYTVQLATKLSDVAIPLTGDIYTPLDDTTHSVNDDWKNLDDLFIMAIKSMVAKIFTVIGTYGVFNKPLPKYSSLGPVRTILGGAAATPEVIPEAIEVYFRSVYLLEFYRDLFDFNKTNDNSKEISVELTGNATKISMVPDFDGLWSVLFRIIFEDARYIKQGNYSDSQVAQIITEVNKIYKHYASPGDRDVVSNIMQALVSEVNRRYGVIKQDEIKKYLNSKDSRFTHNGTYNPDDRFDFDLLDEDESLGRRPAPSDNYDSYAIVKGTNNKAIDNPYSSALKDLVYRFRNQIDTQFSEHLKDSSANFGNATYSFNEVLQEYGIQVKNAKDNEAKYQVVLRALQGGDNLRTPGNYKFLMCYELLFAPLNTIQTIYQYLQNWTKYAKEIKEQYDVAADAKAKNDVNLLMKFTNLLFGMQSQFDDLVHVKVQDTNVVVDFSKLTETVIDMLTVIRKNIERFRDSIPNEIVKDLESSASKVGSLSYIENNFISKFIEGNNNVDDTGKEQDSLDKLSDYMNSIYQVLRDPSFDHSLDFAKLIYWNPNGNPSAKNAIKNDGSVWPFNAIPSIDNFNDDTDVKLYKEINDRLKAYIIEFNTTGTYNGGKVDIATIPSFKFDDKVIENMRKSTNPTTQNLAKIATAYNAEQMHIGNIVKKSLNIPINQRMNWYANPESEYDESENQGLLVRANQILSRYLHLGWDDTTKKIYRGLIDKFANGTFSNAVVQGNALNDVTLDGAKPIGNPKSGVVVFASLARFMRNAMLVNKRNSTDALYRIDNMMDIPQYMKENYKSGLPAFGKLFHLIMRKVDLLKSLLANLKVDGIKVDKSQTNEELHAYVGYEYAGGHHDNTGAWQEAKVSESEQKQYFNTILDNINNMMISLNKCASDTYKEIGDEPKFFETYDGFLNDYSSNYKTEALGLLSQTQIILRENSKITEKNYMLPFYRNGSLPHKLLYGVRLIFNRPEVKLGLEYYPGMANLLAKYNGISTADSKIEKSEYENFVFNHTSLLRFIADIKFAKQFIDKSGKSFAAAVPGVAAVGTTLAVAAVAAKGKGFTVYNTDVNIDDKLQSFALKNDLAAVIDITEGSNQEFNVDKLSNMLNASGSTAPKTMKSRKDALYYNIIDLNIVPINVHAMVRDIPLANIINYAYSCDRMIQNIYNPHGKVLMKISDPVITSKELLVSSLLYPYRPIGGNLLHKLMTGDVETKMGRPRFLSDQLYNKALLRNTYEGVKKDSEPNYNGPNPSGTHNKDKLSYLTVENDKHIIKEVAAADAAMSKLSGQRLNTKIVRNMMFLVNLQRTMRLQMREEIEEFNGPIASSNEVVNWDVTEYSNNDKFDGAEFRQL